MDLNEKGGTYELIMNSLADNVPDLTDEERHKLEEVMKKAKEFDAEEENKTLKPVAGQLFKYTNVVKGWQFRWFVLTPEAGMLEYYMLEETRKSKPRGGLHLAGAVITPSEDDDLSFTVSALCGESYKLKAADARERQFWVNRLRTTAEQHSSSPGEMPLLLSKIHRSRSVSQRDLTNSDHNSKFALVADKKTTLSKGISSSVGYLPADPSPLPAPSMDSLVDIKEWLDKAIFAQRGLANIIEGLPIDGKNLKCSDTALLLLKATSKAMVQSLEECYLILKQRQLAITLPKGLPPGATIKWVDTKRLRNE